MAVLTTAWIGVGVVLVTILALRLHPLIGLLLGALFLLAATPESVHIENEIRSLRHPVVEFRGTLVGLKQMIASGEYYWRQSGAPLIATETLNLRRATISELQSAPEGVDDKLVWYVAQPIRRQDSSTISELPWAGVGNVAEPGSIELIDKSAVDSAKDNRYINLGNRLAAGFAKTFQRLGIPVTMAAIIGICLLESGAAARLVTAIISLLGPRGTAPALTASGFLLGIPVYFDNVFYLLLPLAKAVGRQRPKFYLTAVMAIIVGATMAHSLVPPTPGPLLVASELGVSIGVMMIGGMVVGGVAASVGFLYGSLCSKWVQLETDPTSSSSEKEERERFEGEHKKISLWLAALPIALPMLVLASSEVFMYAASDENSSRLKGTPLSVLATIEPAMSVASDPNLLFIATALLSILILRKHTDSATVKRSMARGLTDAGTIVLLTCAGGTFGAALQQLGLAEALRDRYAGFTTPWGMLMTAFFLTALIRAAQGSATVAMITSVAIVSPIMASIALPFHPVYVALAIGCGSKPLPWMNDSGFWQVATMTGMSTTDTLKTFTVALTLMGLVGFASTLLGAWLLPFV